MLYQRQKWLEQESKLNNPLRRLLFLSAGKTISQEVFETYTFIDRKLLLFDSLLSGLNTAVVVYDLFGHVVQINSRMEKLLQEMDYKPFELTAAEMGSYLTHTDTARIRQQLNKVVTLQESVNMPVITPSHIQKDFMLQITPLQMETEGDSAFEAVQPFRTQGILFELVEITEFKEICTLKDDLLEDFHDRQRRAIEDMASYLSRMDMADIDWEEIKRSVPELQQALNSFVAAKDTINNYISKNLYSETVLEYPIVFNKYLEQAMQSLNLLASNKQLQFSTHSPENPVLVFAVPSLLFKLFYSVLELLIEDATQKSTISVYIEQYNGFMHFNFYNQGFGMPDETFQHYLFSPQAKVSQAFLHIRELLTYVQKWDGDLTGTSTVGEGISFTLKLKTLH